MNYNIYLNICTKNNINLIKYIFYIDKFKKKDDFDFGSVPFVCASIKSMCNTMECKRDSFSGTFGGVRKRDTENVFHMLLTDSVHMFVNN